MPGAVALFAKAYQKQTGGKLTGSEAIKFLLADMKKGKVTGNILTYAGDEAAITAAPGIERASKSSQAEQDRLSNSISAMATIASDNGVEEGFARIFKTISQGMEESTGLVESLAQGFNKATQAFSEFALIPQDLQRMFDGKDSVIADWLWGRGKKGTEDLASLLEIRNLFKNIGELGETAYSGWKQIIKLMDDSPGLKSLGNALPVLNRAIVAINAAGRGDTKTAADSAVEAGTGYLDMQTTIPRKILSLFTRPDADPNAPGHSLSGLLNNFAVNGLGSEGWLSTRDTLTEAGEVLTANQMNHAFDNPYSNRPLDPFAAMKFDSPTNMEAVASQFTSAAQSATTTPSNVTQTFNMDIKFDVQSTDGKVDFSGNGNGFEQWFKDTLGTTAASFPNNQ